MHINLSVPRPLRFELPRPQLHQHLATLRDVPLVALLAPSGYGKTTALAQYARSADHAVGWVTLDAETVDTGQFAELVFLALRGASAEVGEMLEELAQPGQLPDARMVAEQLNACGEHVTLILDQAHLLSEDAGRWLTRLIEGLREGHQVLVGSYGALALPLARLVASGQAEIVSKEVLAFSAEDVQGLTQLESAEAEALTEKLGGWPMALALYRTPGHAHLGVGDLIAEVVAKLPADLRTALPDLAPCTPWSDAFARLSGLDLPAHWLKTLQRCGLPLTPLDDETALPHRELVRWLRLQLSADPARAKRRSGQVAEAYRQCGQPLHAVDALLEAGETLEAEAVVSEWLPGPWQRSEVRTVLEVLLKFPALQNLSLRSVCAYALAEVGRFGEARARLAELPDEAGFRRESALALLHSRQGCYDEALHRVEATYPFQKSVQGGIYLLAHHMLALLAVNRRSEAEQLYYARPPELLDSDDWSCFTLRANLLEVLPFEAQQEYAQIAAHLTQRARQGDTARSPLTLVGVPGMVISGLIRGQTDEAGAALQAAAQVNRGEWDVGAFDLLRAQSDLELATLRLPEVHKTLGDALELAESIKSETCRNQALGRLADLALLNADPATAESHLEKMSPSQHPLDQTLALFVKGAGQLLAGEQIAARDTLARAAEVDVFSLYRWRALALLRASGDTRTVNCPQPEDVPWLESLTQRLIDRQTAQPQQSSQTPALANAPLLSLSVRTFRRLEVQVSGQLVHFPFAKAAELFAYLVTHGPSEREELVDALWNGSGDPKHLDYFRVAVRRLRLALGEVSLGLANPVPLVNGAYRLSEEYALSADFQTLSEAASQFNPAQVHAAWAAYDGPFLPKLDSDWADTQRQALHDQFTELTLGYAAQQACEQPDEAIAAYQQLLKLDPINEQAHEGLIRLQLESGAPALAQHSYGVYTRMMREEYGVGPSLALQRLLAERSAS